MRNEHRARHMEKAISALMQELIKEAYPQIGPVATAFQTIRSKPELLARLHKHLEKK